MRRYKNKWTPNRSGCFTNRNGSEFSSTAFTVLKIASIRANTQRQRKNRR